MLSPSHNGSGRAQAPSGRPAVSLARKGLHKKDDGAARKTMGLGGPLGQTYHFGRTVSVKCFLNQNPYVDAFDSTAEKLTTLGALKKSETWVPFWLSRRVPLKLPAAPLGCTLVVSMHSSC
jgi:hypothetical protein